MCVHACVDGWVDIKVFGADILGPVGKIWYFDNVHMPIATNRYLERGITKTLLSLYIKS